MRSSGGSAYARDKCFEGVPVMQRIFFFGRVLGAMGALLVLSACGNGPTAPTTPPAVASVTPASGTVGTTLPVTITGTGFVVGESIAAAISGPGVTVSHVAIQSPTTITATVTIAADASLGSRALTVIRASSGTSTGVAFSILPPPPTLSAIAPATVVTGGTGTLTLSGTHFVPGATTVAINGGGSR